MFSSRSEIRPASDEQREEWRSRIKIDNETCKYREIFYPEDILALDARIEQQAAEIERYRGALLPFAEWYEDVAGQVEDDDEVRIPILAEYLRAARVALEGDGDE